MFYIHVSSGASTELPGNTSAVFSVIAMLGVYLFTLQLLEMKNYLGCHQTVTDDIHIC